jgi:hypothetical protein
MRRLLLISLLAACTTTIDSTDPQGSPEAPDAGTAVGGGGGGGGGGGVDAGATTSMFPCKNLGTANGNGHHNAGQDCMQGCHNHGFTLSGTLYGAAGTTALAGGTITVTDSAGKTLNLVTAQNGNFYTSQAIAFPITVYASACPTSMPMTASIANGNGGCNKSGCHANGAQGHIHL